MSDNQGLFENMESTCGCGKPARYTSKDGKGSCNKYKRCPSYDELRAEKDKVFELYGFLMRGLTDIILDYDKNEIGQQVIQLKCDAQGMRDAFKV